MAKYNCIYKCGHSETVQLFGKMDSRNEYLAWAAENKLCPDCYRAEIENRNARRNILSAQRAEVEGLPALTGSDKQIAWANTIRDGALERWRDHSAPSADQIRAKFPSLTDAEHAEIQSFVAAISQQWITDIISAKTDSRWWIDNRNNIGTPTSDPEVRIAIESHPLVAQILERTAATKKAEAEIKEAEAKIAAAELAAKAAKAKLDQDTDRARALDMLSRAGSVLKIEQKYDSLTIYLDGATCQGYMDGSAFVYAINGLDIPQGPEREALEAKVTQFVAVMAR